jgi:hypothetical protein
MKGIFLNTLAHPRLDCARLLPSRRRVLPCPSGRTQTSSPFSTGLASRAHSPRPGPAPLPDSGRDESAVLFCRHYGDHVLHQPSAIATGFH